MFRRNLVLRWAAAVAALSPAALAALAPVAVLLATPAAAQDPALRCSYDIARVHSGATSKYFACAKGDPAKLADCVMRLGSKTGRAVVKAVQRSNRTGVLCPSSAAAFGTSGPWSWPVRLLQSSSDGGISDCGAAQGRVARGYAVAFGRCLERSVYDPEAFDACEQAARAAYLAKWIATGPCNETRAAGAFDRIAAEMDGALTRMLRVCDDPDPVAYERCDDGNTASDDGCSAECRAESCGRVGEDVLCIACPADSVADETFAACRCRDGSEGEPGSCTVVDQCVFHAGECPVDRPCVNLEGGRWACAIPCDAASFHAALASCGAPSGAIAFDCSDATIEIPAGTSGQRDVSCDGLVIDGKSPGANVAFELAPACWQTPLAPEQCPGGLATDGTCFCPDVDAGEQFLLLRGDRNVVRNLSVRNFFEGIPVRGEANVVEHVAFDRMCDDAFGSVARGVANVFRHLTVAKGCDKCSENAGEIADLDTDPRVDAHYNAIFSDITFEGCRTPVRAAAAGRFLLEDVRMQPGTEEFPCDGPHFSGGTETSRVVVEIARSTIGGCRRGVRFGRGVEALVRDSRVADSALRGIRLGGNARASIEGVTIENNGGGGSAEDGFGGVAVKDQAVVDLGGGLVDIDGVLRTSAGENTLCNNRAPDGGRRDLEAPLETLTPAKNNWWCTTEPADRIAGSASIDPVLQHAPLRYLP